MNRAPIDFYFDLSSPYSYIAAHWIDPLAQRCSRPLRWHAILLGATFQAAELKPPVAHPLKREYALRDFERSARFAGVPLVLPQPFPIATQNAARIYWWLLEREGETRTPAAQAAKSWARRCWRAYFVDGIPIAEAEGLARVAADHGLDPAEVAAVCADPVWKARLKRANDEAIAAGVFGAPFFIVDGEPFWGNDRRPQIERWLERGPF